MRTTLAFTLLFTARAHAELTVTKLACVRAIQRRGCVDVSKGKRNAQG